MKITITILVLVHFMTALWHGDAHTVLEINLPAVKTLFIYLVIVLAPLAGTILLWTRYYSVGIAVVTISMASSLAFGVYHHYILISPDNIAHLPAGLPAAQAQFINSAALIALFELVSALVGAYALLRFREPNSSLS